MSESKPTPPAPAGKPAPERVRFHYIKSPQFASVHADGLIGGPTPRGGLHLAFYAERAAIPTQVEHALVDGKLGDEIKEARVQREGIVRELQVDVFLDLNAAERVLEWFERQVKGVQAKLGEEKVEGEHDNADNKAEGE
jgi:hypothetical protein